MKPTHNMKITCSLAICIMLAVIFIPQLDAPPSYAANHQLDGISKQKIIQFFNLNDASDQEKIYLMMALDKAAVILNHLDEDFKSKVDKLTVGMTAFDKYPVIHSLACIPDEQLTDTLVESLLSMSNARMNEKDKKADDIVSSLSIPADRRQNFIEKAVECKKVDLYSLLKFFSKW